MFFHKSDYSKKSTWIFLFQKYGKIKCLDYEGDQEYLLISEEDVWNYNLNDLNNNI